MRLLLAAVLTMLALASPAQAATVSWTDPFDGLDPARWSSSPHFLGRGALDPANATASGGALRLTLPAERYDGAEVYTGALYRAGRFSARMRVPDAPGSISALFLYAPPDYGQELDIELFNERTGKVWVTAYAGGRQTQHAALSLGFDPTAGFHTYEIEWSRKEMSFFADGRLLRRWRTGVPRNPMRLYLNAWWPVWLSGPAPAAPVSADVDWVAASGDAD
jgi:endo-1,3-1,4-beta-glycanase ExoK